MDDFREAYYWYFFNFSHLPKMLLLFNQGFVWIQRMMHELWVGGIMDIK